jgi:hypothetical protein
LTKTSTLRHFVYQDTGLRSEADTSPGTYTDSPKTPSRESSINTYDEVRDKEIILKLLSPDISLITFNDNLAVPRKIHDELPLSKPPELNDKMMDLRTIKSSKRSNSVFQKSFLDFVFGLLKTIGVPSWHVRTEDVGGDPGHLVASPPVFRRLHPIQQVRNRSAEPSNAATLCASDLSPCTISLFLSRTVPPVTDGQTTYWPPLRHFL